MTSFINGNASSDGNKNVNSDVLSRGERNW
jgi:hypothetical protein